MSGRNGRRWSLLSSEVNELSPRVVRKSCSNHEFDAAVSPFWKRRRTQHQTADIDPIGAVRGTPRPATAADIPPRPAHAIAQCRKRDCDVSLLRSSGAADSRAARRRRARSAAFPYFTPFVPDVITYWPLRRGPFGRGQFLSQIFRHQS